MNWGIEDVVAATMLVAAAALAVWLVRRFVRRKSSRLLLTILVGLVFLATWAHLAVGIV